MVQSSANTEAEAIKPRTADAWATYLSYINAQIGEMPLTSVNNLAVKELIAKMASEVKRTSRVSPRRRSATTSRL